MHDLKAIFLCSKCGEVDAEMIEVIDINRDDIEYEVLCYKCRGTVRPKIEDGVQCYRQMSEDEILAEMGFFDDPDFQDYDTDDDYDF